MDIEVNYNGTRVGTNRTLTDGYLWEWLSMYAVREFCIDIKIWTPINQTRLEELMANISFTHDSIDFCIELTEAIDIAIEDGYDPEYGAFPADFYRRWDAALNWVPLLKEPE
jgi:hypothetical protein